MKRDEKAINLPIRDYAELEYLIEQETIKLQTAYQNICLLEIERDLGIRVTPLEDGGAIIDGEHLNALEFNAWIQEIIEAMETIKEEEQVEEVKEEIYDA